MASAMTMRSGNPALTADTFAQYRAVPGAERMTLSGTVSKTTTTDANGNYSFPNLVPGTYRVREVQQANWVQTTSNPGPISAVSGVDVSGVNFGNARFITITGQKFDDLNGNGIKDVFVQEDEPGKNTGIHKGLQDAQEVAL